MSDLAIYDRMCFAIAECHRVDEVKNLRDKAQALELYARQCKNTEAERQAANVRLRAERRTGELLAELADDGAAYTWGSDGRLGLGDGQPLRRLTWVPQAVFAGSRVTMRHGVLRRHAHDGAASGDGSGARMDLRHERIRQLGVVDLTSRLAFAQVDAGQLGGAGARGW